MLFVFLDCDLNQEDKDYLREQIKENTGENSLILGPHFLKVCQFPVKKDRAASLWEKPPRLADNASVDAVAEKLVSRLEDAYKRCGI